MITIKKTEPYDGKLKWKNWFENIFKRKNFLGYLYNGNPCWILLFIATMGFLVLLLPFKNFIFRRRTA